MRRLLLVAVLAIGLGGCATLNSSGTSILQGGQSITAPITNPVQPVTVYQVKNVYAAALELADGYREYCWARPYAILMADPLTKPICQNRRPNVRRLQKTQAKASAAIQTVDNFVRNNPTLSATQVLSAAWTAVQDFQALANSMRK